jgi:putative addiction module component (TIGR02574 family)
MTARTTSIAEAAERLPAADRMRLVEHLLSTLHKPDPDIDRAWADESERRLVAHVQGETTARDAKDVLAKDLKP